MLSKLFDARCVMMAFVGGLLCGCANLDSIHREFDLRTNTSQIVDVNQRAIFVDTDKNTGRHMICPEPSPDALSVFAGTLAAKGSSDKISVDASGSVSASGAAFGLRTQSIQLQRDAYSITCLAWLSGALDKHQYGYMLRRYGNQVVALLAIEQLTQAIRPQIVSVSSNTQPPAPSNGQSPSNKPANGSGSGAGSTSSGSGTQPGTPTSAIGPGDSLPFPGTALIPASYQFTSGAPQDQVVGPQAGADQPPPKPAVEKPVPQTDKPTTASNQSGTLVTTGGTTQQSTQSDNNAVATAVHAIADSVINEDYAGQLCLSYFEGVEDGTYQGIDHLTKFCGDVLSLYVNQRSVSLDYVKRRSDMLLNYFNKNCGGADSLSSDAKKACDALVVQISSANAEVPPIFQIRALDKQLPASSIFGK